MIKITRTSVISGQTNSMVFDITQDQLDQYEAGGVTIQEVFPNLSPDEREFIKTGITPEEWNELFLEESDEEDYDEDDYQLEQQFEAYRSDLEEDF